MNKTSIFLILLIFLDAVPCKNLVSFTTTTTIATITSDNENELVDAIAILNKNGGTISISTPIIHIKSTCSLTLSGSIKGGIVGNYIAPGVFPVIDFSNCASNDNRGFKISGSSQFIKYLFIQYASKGIWITGPSNYLEFTISRYNSDSGIFLSDNARLNSFHYCFSYRNGNSRDSCENGDGFTQMPDSNENVFHYCFAWDNYGNGWSLYDKEEDKTALTTILNSASWNNGNPEVFSGKYDYGNRWPLDKNLLTIKNIMDEDPNYESNYKNRKFAISPLGPYTKYFLNTWIPKAKLEGGNGFKIGSKIKQRVDYVKRIINNSLAFDNKYIGFLSDDSETRFAAISNCISFKNNINYQMTNRLLGGNSNWSYDPIKSDQFKQNQAMKTPRNKDSATRSIYYKRDEIINYCRQNYIRDKVNFDNVFKTDFY